jgi:hypothetical protein
MHDTNVDYFINVRPQYLQDGGKKPDVYTRPAPLRDTLQGKLGLFPLHRFWGPGAGIEGSEWIADASKLVDAVYDPMLTFVYLPHMDYSLQLYGPDDTEHGARFWTGICSSSLLLDPTIAGVKTNIHVIQ